MYLIVTGSTRWTDTLEKGIHINIVACYTYTCHLTSLALQKLRTLDSLQMTGEISQYQKSNVWCARCVIMTWTESLDFVAIISVYHTERSLLRFVTCERVWLLSSFHRILQSLIYGALFMLSDVLLAIFNSSFDLDHQVIKIENH